MKLMNQKQSTMKGIIIGVFLGTVLTGSITVTAVTLTAKEIKYTPNNQNFTATNAEEALNEIYKIAEYEIPEDTYFYEQGTEGDSTTIKRYKKINDEYFVCDEYGKVDEGIDAADVTSKTLIPYTSTSAKNISAGSAGYASGKFYLGDGTDNITFKKEGNLQYLGSYVGTYPSMPAGAAYNGTNYPITYTTVDISEYNIPNYEELTIDNFHIVITGIKGKGGTSSNLGANSFDKIPTKEYDGKTLKIASGWAAYGVYNGALQQYCGANISFDLYYIES